MESFTPWSSLFGGTLIGLAATALFIGNGRTAGTSGIFGGLFYGPSRENLWRWFFLAGMAGGGAVLAVAMPNAFPAALPRSIPWLIVAGLLVGFGTRLGEGCTSGHGICGNARFSVRSLVATVTFMATGALAVLAANHLLGSAS